MLYLNKKHVLLVRNNLAKIKRILVSNYNMLLQQYASNLDLDVSVISKPADGDKQKTVINRKVQCVKKKLLINWLPICVMVLI